MRIQNRVRCSLNVHSEGIESCDEHNLSGDLGLYNLWLDVFEREVQNCTYPEILGYVLQGQHIGGSLGS